MDWPGEKILTRVIDALEKSVGGALRPWQIRRVENANTEARVRERLLLEQTELDIADLKAGRKKLDANRKLIPNDVSASLLLESPNSKFYEKDSSKLSDFAQAAQESAYAQELQRAVNLKRVALYAEESAEEIDQQATDKKFSSESKQPDIDKDWFEKWRSGAQEVSREEMQRLWGILLTGEIARPGSYSLHTVEFLSRMSSSDANLLARLAPFASSSGIIKISDEFFAEHGLKFQDFLYLDDLGIINGTVGVGGLQLTLGQSEASGYLISNLIFDKIGMAFFTKKADSSPQKLVFEIFTLTQVGREILTLASIPTNFDYIKKVSEKAISLGVEEVKIGDFHESSGSITNLQTIARKNA